MARYRSYDIPALRRELRDAFPQGSIVAEHTETEHWYRESTSGVLAPSVTTIQGLLDKRYLRQWAVDQAIEHVAANRERFASDSESVLQEAKRAHENKRDASANWGTNAHKAYEDYLNEWIAKGEKPAGAAQYLDGFAAPEEIAACRSFEKFVHENEFTPIMSEAMVFHSSAGILFAGTADAVVVARVTHKDRKGDARCAHDYARQDSGILWCSACSREAEEKLVLLDHKTSNSIKKPEYAQQVTAYTHAIEKRTKWKFDEIWITRYDKSRADYEVLVVSDRKTAWELFKANAKHFAAVSKHSGKNMLTPLHQKTIIRI